MPASATLYNCSFFRLPMSFLCQIISFYHRSARCTTVPLFHSFCDATYHRVTALPVIHVRLHVYQ